MSEIKTPYKFDRTLGVFYDGEGGYASINEAAIALNEHADLKAQVAELTEANERYRKALERFALDDSTAYEWTGGDDGCYQGIIWATAALHPKQEEQE